MPCSSVELCRCSHIWMWHSRHKIPSNSTFGDDLWRSQYAQRETTNSKRSLGSTVPMILLENENTHNTPTTWVKVWPHDWFVDWHEWWWCGDKILGSNRRVARVSKGGWIFLPPPTKCRYLTPTPKLMGKEPEKNKSAPKWEGKSFEPNRHDFGFLKCLPPEN